MFKPPAHCQGLLHLLLWPHEQHFLLYLHLQMVDCESKPVLSGYQPSNWQDVCGQTHTQKKWRLATRVGRRQRRRKAQGPRLSPSSGTRCSFPPLLNEILTTEELIKTTSCTTEPLCCYLASH